MHMKCQNCSMDKHFQNSTVKTSKLLHKSPKTLAKIVKIKMFGTLKINERCVKLQEALIQENWLNPLKKSELCGCLICSIPTPFSTVVLQTNSLTTMVN